MRIHTFTDGMNTGMVDVEIGARATVYRVAGYKSTVGEGATLARATDKHLVFVTDSGAEVKTSNWNLFDVRGKAAKAGYGVRLGEMNLTRIEKVSFWNSKKCCFEKK